jgi:hypothetical protein
MTQNNLLTQAELQYLSTFLREELNMLQSSLEHDKTVVQYWWSKSDKDDLRTVYAFRELNLVKQWIRQEKKRYNKLQEIQRKLKKMM